MEREDTKDKTNETKKDCLFSFAKINKYFIIPFLCPVFCMIGNFFINLILQENELRNKEFPIIMVVGLTYFGGGLLYFISSIRNKTEETRENAIVYKERQRSLSSIKYIYNDGLKKDKIKIFGFLLIMSIFLALLEICSLYSLYKHIFEERMYFLFFIPLFSKYILKNDILNHQILSLIISFIGMIFLFIPTLLVIETDDIFLNICTFISSIGYSLYLVLVKHLTQSYYLSPYLCLLYLGIISEVLIIIGYVLYSLISYQNLSVIIDCFDFSGVENGIKIFFYYVGIFIFGTILQVLSILVIFYFSPTLLMVTDIISPMLSWIVLSIMNSESIPNIIFYSLGYCIVLLASLIYNEIIICNFYDFNKYTKKCLEERQKEELILLRKTENQIKAGNLNQENENDTSYYSENDNENENENENDNENDNENNNDNEKDIEEQN